jgi:hypothetical protein
MYYRHGGKGGIVLENLGPHRANKRRNAMTVQHNKCIPEVWHPYQPALMSERLIQWMKLAQSEYHQEIDQINSLIRWLFASQTFLFAAFTAVIRENLSGVTLQQSKILIFLGALIPPFGITTTTCILVGILGAYLAMFQLNKRLERHHPSRAKSVIYQGRASLIMSMIGSTGITIASLGIWIVLLINWHIQFP